MIHPTKPGYDAGFPEQSDKACAHPLPDGSWCIKKPLHDGACEGKPARAMDTSSIRSYYAAGTPKP